MILNSLFRHRTRTLLTAVGIAIGVTAIVALGALSAGLSQAYGSLGGGGKADMLVAQEEAVDIVFSAVDEQVGEALAGVPAVEDVTGKRSFPDVCRGGAARRSSWGGAGMTNTMVMSVFERTREIGVLRALGWSRLRVVWMVLRESVVLSSLGGVVRVAIGIGVVGVINALPFLRDLRGPRLAWGFSPSPCSPRWC